MEKHFSICTCVNCEQALHLHHGYWWASSAVTLSDSSWILQCMHLIFERKALCAHEMEQQHRSYICKQAWWTSPATTSHAPEPRKPGSLVMLGYCPKLGMFLQHEIFIHNQNFVTRKLHHSLEASEKGPEKCGKFQPHICNQCMSLKSSYQPEFQSHYKSYFAGNRQKWGFYQVGNLHDRCKVAEHRQQFSSEAKVCCHSDLLSMWEGLLLDNAECDLQAHLH